MSNDQLRLVASVEDRFSAPLGRLRAGINEATKTQGIAGLRKEFNEFEAVVGRLRQAATGLNAVGGLGGMLGFGGIGGALSIAGVAAAMRELSNQTLEMRHLGRETGIAAGQLRELQALGKGFHIAPEAMAGNLKGFSDRLFDIRNGLGAVSGELRQLAPGLYKQLRESSTTFDALDKSLSFLGRIKDPTLQKRWAETLGLGDMTRLFDGGLPELQRRWKEIRESGVGKDNPALEQQAKALTEALNRFDTSVETMKQNWGPALLSEMAGAVGKLNDEFAKFGRAIQALKEGRYLDALSQADRGRNWNEARPGAAGKPTALDEQLDAQMRGQKALSAEDKRRGEIHSRLKAAESELDYEKRRFPVRDEAQQRKLTEEIAKLNEELRRLRETGATVQQQSFNGPATFRDLIHNAALRSPGGFGGGYGGGWGGDGAISSGGGRARGGTGPTDEPGASASTDPVAPFRQGGRGRHRDNFDEKAAQITPRLMREFKLSREQAAGIVANLGHESGGFRFYQEVKPRRGRGGAGWAQWTGARRRQFEAWAAREGLDPRSDEASYGFLTRGDPEFAAALRAVRRTRSVEDATVAFERSFERAGVKAYASRFKFGRRAMQLPDTDSDAPPEMSRMGDASMLRRAQRAGVMGGGSGPTSLDGSVSVNLRMDGFPGNVRTQTSMNGVVKAVKLNRGHSMGERED